MLEQLRTDRLAQLMLIGVIIASLFACAIVCWFGFLFFNSSTQRFIPFPTQPLVSTPVVPPTTTPEPTPTKVNSLSMLEFNYEDVSITQSDDYIKIIGSVQNNSSETCFFVEVTVQYFDTDDSLITFDKNYLEFTSIKPTQTSPFKITTRLPPGSPKPDRFSLSLSSLAGCIPPE